MDGAQRNWRFQEAKTLILGHFGVSPAERERIFCPDSVPWQ
jgi:hypothetical protein